jgi:hypothetical protein
MASDGGQQRMPLDELEERMRQTYTERRDDQRQEAGHTLWKTYLMEAHVGPAMGAEEISDTLLHNFPPSLSEGGLRLLCEPHPASDLMVKLTLAESGGGSIGMLVDVSNPRFWLSHTLDPARRTDRLLSQLIDGTSLFDRAWLSIDLLYYAADLGELRGLRLDYDARELFSSTEEAEDELEVGHLKVDFRGPDPGRLVDIFENEASFSRLATLDKVIVRSEGASNADFAISDVKFNGKLTTRGTSRAPYEAMIGELRNHYAQRIKGIEEALQLTIATDGAALPVTLRFEQPFGDAAELCKRLFRAARPFRLWGTPVPIGDDIFSVAAIDLHVGNPIDFEVGPDWMRAYVHKGGCGNTILRLITNFQHHIDARVEAWIDDRPVSELESQDAEPRNPDVP